MYKDYKQLFKYKEELLNLGVQGLYDNFLNIMKDIDLKEYILDFSGMPDKYAELLGFKNYEEVKKNNREDAEILIDKNIIYKLCKNIIKQANDKNSLVGEMFCSNSYPYNYERDLEIRFEVKAYGGSKHYKIEFGLISLHKGSGGGNSFRIYLTNKKVIEEEIEKIKKSNLKENTKTSLLNLFENEYQTDEIDFESDIKAAKEGIFESITDNIDYFKDKFLNYKSLKEQQFHKCLSDDFTDFIHIFDEEIEFKYRNENILDVYFCNELIKTIKKISYTAYDIY